MEQIGYIIFGWLLGILGPGLVRGIERKYRKREIGGGILAEVTELRIRLAANIFKITQRYGTVNRAFLNSLLPVYQGYRGTYPIEETRKALEAFAAASDENIATVVAAKRAANPNSVLNLKRFNLPYLETNIGNLDLFPEAVKFIVLEILVQINNLNEEVKDSQYYIRLTFDSSLTTANHALVSGNVVGSCLSVCKNAELLIDKINHLEQLLG